jgi:hypothetical protein
LNADPDSPQRHWRALKTSSDGREQPLVETNKQTKKKKTQTQTNKTNKTNKTNTEQKEQKGQHEHQSEPLRQALAIHGKNC